MSKARVLEGTDACSWTIGLRARGIRLICKIKNGVTEIQLQAHGLIMFLATPEKFRGEGLATAKKLSGKPNFRRPASPPRWRRRGTTNFWDLFLRFSPDPRNCRATVPRSHRDRQEESFGPGFSGSGRWRPLCDPPSPSGLRFAVGIICVLWRTCVFAYYLYANPDLTFATG